MKKKMTALALALGLLLAARPVQAEPLPGLTLRPTPGTAIECENGVGNGQSGINATFQGPDYTLVVPAKLAFGALYWNKNSTYEKNLTGKDLYIGQMTAGYFESGWKIQVNAGSGKVKEGSFALSNAKGDTIPFKVTDAAGSEVGLNGALATLAQTGPEDAALATLRLTPPQSETQLNLEYSGSLIFTTRLVPPAPAAKQEVNP